MRYRIEFLDAANAVVHVRHAEAGSYANAFLLVAAKDWPPDAVSARLVDKPAGRELVDRFDGWSLSRPLYVGGDAAGVPRNTTYTGMS